jgi:iron complex transport system ATP-binding protein
MNVGAVSDARRGMLFTTHDPNHALRSADRAYLLRDGKPADGPVATVLTRGQLKVLYHAIVERLPDSGAVAFCRLK